MPKAKYKRQASLLALMIAISIAAFAALGLLTTAAAEDWPQFRGPNGTGVSASHRATVVDFGPEKNVVWKTALPPGHSSPVLTKDHIFVTAYGKVDNKQPAAQSQEKAKTEDKENYKLLVICLDATDGQIALATRGAAFTCGPLAERQWTGVAQPRH